MNSLGEKMQSLTLDTPVKLLVGERVFTTARNTLISESTYFTSLLSGRWGEPQEDGAYFIDADPSLFEHILRFLRHNTFPLFYDQERGHDFGLYVALLGEAKYFGISRLQKWLEDKTYLQAIQVQQSMQVIEEWDDRNVTTNSDTSTVLRPTWHTKRVYVCPRGILVHRGDPSRCGRQCNNAKVAGGSEYDEEHILQVAVVKKKTVVRPELCMA
ncbi:hypothetical protein E4U42_000304 [Claviceps africana]|uniref:BTB domain-containing protein n=1 Tax=Claviceps africana TaxID=83212 RepID=A0A8K0J0Q4_9HYPO|nr:hypothetical protein E4U42_000304 [Claviceps africana]